MIKRNLPGILIILALVSGGCNSGGKDDRIRKEKTTIQKKYDRAGRVVSEVSIKDGLKHGPTRNYYESGKLHSIVHYNEGKLHGESVWYYENGQPYQVTPYINGKRNGIQKKYYQSGKLMAEVPFIKGEQQPGMKEYSETGKLITDYPEIVFEKPQKTASPNRMILKIHLSNNSKEVTFHQRIISSTDDTLMAEVPTKDGIGEFTFFISKGELVETDLTIVAKTKTRLRNNYIIEGVYHVKIQN